VVPLRSKSFAGLCLTALKKRRTSIRCEGLSHSSTTSSFFSSVK
jgi:hypothetical protein